MGSSFAYEVLLVVIVSVLLSVQGGTNDNKVSASKTNQHDLTNENTVERITNKKQPIYEPVPCQMVYSRYGCCWDEKSIPKGPNGEGCPVCRDHRHMRCKNWKPFCKDRFVKAMCPQSCGVCSKSRKSQDLDRHGNCKDDAIWRKMCPVYRDLRFCRQTDIAHHCRRSCGKC